MGCPHCESAATSERRVRTALGYRRFRSHTCQREFNERTGTRFNHLQYSTEISRMDEELRTPRPCNDKPCVPR